MRVGQHPGSVAVCGVRSTAIVVCLAATVFSGCSITGKNASIDSTSRMPFFGMELAPKRRAPAPETQRIRRDRSQTPEPEPAKLVVNGAQSDKDSTWWKKLTQAEQRPSIPLRRTDVVEPVPAAKPVVKIPTGDVPVEF